MAINKNNIIKAAQKFIEKGQLDKAIKEYRKIVQADPKDIRVRLKIGDLLVNKGALKDAAATYRQVAEAYMEQGFQTRAIAVFKQVLKLVPQDVEVHKKLAELFRQKELVNDALIQLELLYKTLMKMERREEAREVVQEMVSLDDQNVALRIRLAESFSRENMRKEAVEQFTVAARLLRSGERPQDYIKVAERLLWHDPENVEVSKELARRYLAMNEPRRALQKLQAAFKADSQGVETLNLLAESFQGLKQGDKAATILKELAKVLSMRGDREGARKTYRKVLGLTPKDKEAQKALRDLEGRAAIKDVPSQPAVIAEPIQASAQIPDSGEVIDYDEIEEIEDIEEIEEFEEIDPEAIVETEDLSNESEEVESILQDVDAFVKYNLYDKAIEHIQGFLATYPNNLTARIRYAELLADAGRIPEAVSEYRVVSGTMQEEEPETAISLLDRALQLVPDNEEVAAELGALTGRSTEDIMAAVAGADGPEGDDFSELSGLRILEDIEAEAETMQPTFATQEISVSKVEGLSHLRKRSLRDGFKDAKTMDDSIEDLDGLGLLEDADWGGEDVVDLEGIGEISFGPAEPTMESTSDGEPFGGDDREGFIATTQGGMEGFSFDDDDNDDAYDEIHLPDDDGWGLENESGTAEEGLKKESEKVDPSTVGDGFPLSEEMGRELADLENELDLLSPSVLPTASDAPDTAVVDVDSIDEPESEAPREDELVLRPPEDEPVLDGAGAMPGSEDYLLDELDQLEEAQQLIAELKEATGEQSPVGGGGAIKESSEEADDEVEVDFGDLEVDDSQEPAAMPSLEEPEGETGKEESEARKPDMVGDLQGLADSWDEPEEARESNDWGENSLSKEGAGTSEGGEPAFTQERLQSLRDEMEETEFFISQELYQDALDMLTDLKDQFGEHPELMAKIRDISFKIDSSDAGEEDDAESEGENGDVSLEESSVAESARDVEKKDSEAELVEDRESDEVDDVISEERLEEVDEVLDSAVDALADMELMDLDESSAEEPTQVQSQQEQGSSMGLEGRDAEVFKKFRDGVATQVEEDDSDTHFDLGIAYKEMGMVEDAMKEFQKAMKSTEKEVQSHMLLAVCYLDVGKLSNAVNEYKQALHSQNITPEEQLDAYYQMGTVYEKMGDLAESVYYLEKVKKRLPSYRDVGDRLAGLYEKLET